jgi:6-phosphofructokinase 1
MPGNLLVGQSGGCTAVMNASLAGVLAEAARQASVGRVYGALHGVLGLLQDELVELDPEDAALRRHLRRTPAAALGSIRHRLSDDEVERVFSALRRLDVRFFHYIGGNDSADTSLRIARAAADAGYDLRVVAVPKTVDNDLPEMDHSPGFGSAARFLAAAVQDAAADTRAMRHTDPVKVIEVGGRHAGWLAAAAALHRRSPEDAPQLVYLPEQPLEPERALADVASALDRTGWAVIVVSEGVRRADGSLLAAMREGVFTDRFGHPQLVGAGRALMELIAARLGVRVKYDRPGSLQRLLRAYQSPVDVREAERAGRAAVRFAHRGRTGAIAALQAGRVPRYRSWLTPVPLERIANRERPLPADFLAAPDAYPTAAFRSYATPLIGRVDLDATMPPPAWAGLRLASVERPGDGR